MKIETFKYCNNDIAKSYHFNNNKNKSKLSKSGEKIYLSELTFIDEYIYDYINNKWNFAKERLINHNNDNFSQGVNYLFKLSDPKDDDLVLLLNNDIIFNDTQSLKKMINLFTKNKNVGVVGAKLLSLDKKTINHAGVVFSNINKLPKHFRAMELDDNYSKMNREFQAITGAVFLTRGDIYRQAGMLPEHMRWAFDDIFLSLSIKYNLNKRIIMAGDVNISHDESSSLKKNPVNKLYMNHNIQSFFKAWNSKYIIDENLYLKDKNFNIIK